MLRKRVTSLVIAALAVALAGCVGNERVEEQSDRTAPMTDGRCHADQAQFTLGKSVTPALLDQAKARSGAQTVRALKPNDMITLDYRAERLNLNTDADGVVQRVNCG